jgi:Fur family peroxide stress response transcriptional regulator
MLKRTAQSKFIYEFIKNTKNHPSVEDIYREANKKLPYITRATIYNVLKRLVSKGEVKELFLKKGLSVYDGNPEPHPHLRCKVCGKIEDIELSGFSAFLDEIKMVYPEGDVDLSIIDVCSECKIKLGGEEDGN